MEQPTGILPKGTRVRTHKVLDQGRMLCGPRTPDREGTIGNVVGGMGGDVYVVDHGGGQMAAYCWDEFEIVLNRPTVEDMAAILAEFRAKPVLSEFRSALDELIAKNDPQRFAVNAASLAQLNVAAEPYAEQSAAGREAWTNAATMAAYLLLHAVHAAKSTP